MNSFSFEDKDPRFTKLKPGLALRLLIKGLFYIRAMLETLHVLTYKGRQESRGGVFVIVTVY